MCIYHFYFAEIALNQNSLFVFRARTMTRFDGFENIGRLVGTALSPIILMNLGKFACFGLQVGCVFLGILYIVLFLPKISPKDEDLENCKLQQDSTALHSELKKENSAIRLPTNAFKK